MFCNESKKNQSMTVNEQAHTLDIYHEKFVVASTQNED